jgi:hypothetical protein
MNPRHHLNHRRTHECLSFAALPAVGTSYLVKIHCISFPTFKFSGFSAVRNVLNFETNYHYPQEGQTLNTKQDWKGLIRIEIHICGVYWFWIRNYPSSNKNIQRITVPKFGIFRKSITTPRYMALLQVALVSIPPHKFVRPPCWYYRL